MKYQEEPGIGINLAATEKVRALSAVEHHLRISSLFFETRQVCGLTMAKTSKKTKKFQKKHLKHTLEHRREVQKHNKKAERRRGAGNGKPGKSDAPAEPKERKSARPVFDDMSVEEFFDGGFEIPKPKKGVKIDEEGVEDDDEDEDEEDEDEDEDEDDEEGAEDDEAGSGIEEESAEAADEDDESSEEEDEETMKADMKALEENDPEFFKYLQKNDKKLLDFEGVNPLDAMSDDSESSDEEEASEKAEKKQKADQVEITSALVAKWTKQLKTKPLANVLKTVINAFKSIVYSTTQEENTTMFKLEDPAVFNDLMLLGLRVVPQAIQKLAPYKTNLKGVRAVDQNLPASRVMGRLLKNQASSYIIILDDITNTETAALVLSSIQELLPHFMPQRKLVKQIMNAAVEAWATTTDVQTQVAAYAFMNNAAREFPKSVLEIVLRSSYSAFLKNCRKTNVHTMDAINFAKNSAAELFGIDELLSYQVGFEFVRQLAIHLRNTISSTSNVTATSGKDAYKAIYNWQFCHSLDFWSRILAQQCNPEKEFISHKNHESPLRALIYPLVQVTLGAIRLIPTAQFFPLRFYLIRSLIRLSQGSGVYIPIYPLIAEILTSTAFTKPPKNAALPALDFDYIVKVNQQYLGTRVYQEGLCDQFLDLTSEFLVLYSKSIAFPELVTPVILSLRRFMKKSKIAKFNKQLLQLVEKLNSNATYITQKRKDVEYGPSNKAEVQAFLKEVKWESTPLGQYVVVHRKLREERARVLKEAILEEEKAKQKTKSSDMQLDQDVAAFEDEEEKMSVDEDDDE